MKEDDELGVSDDKESIFSTLKSRNSSKSRRACMKEEKKGPQKSSFLRTQFVRVYINKGILVYEDDLCLQTSASTVY